MLSGWHWPGSAHENQMTRFAERPTTFVPRRSGSSELTAHEQATVFAAREILARHINCNPVLTSWQAVMDYCALYAEAEIMPMLVFKSLFLAGIVVKGLA